MSVLWEHMTPEERRSKVALADLKYAYLMSGGTLELAEELAEELKPVANDDDLMTSRDVCAALGIGSIRTVNRLRVEQGLPGRKIRGKYMFAPDDVVAWAKEARRRVNLRALRAGSGS